MTNRAARFSITAIATLGLLAGCAGKPTAIAVAPPPPPPAVAIVTMPAGAHAGMAIPAVLADGRYATPNRDLSPAGTIWHLRAALNVAALACRGADEAIIIAGYNALLTREKATLAAAEASYAGEYRATSATDWRDRYDDAQTRLYNFFSQSPARTAFCQAAAATLNDAAYVDDAALPGFAAGRLAVLEKPFTDFYRAYDAWRAQAPATLPVAPPSPPPPASTMVMASAAPVAARSQTAMPHVPLELDPSVFQDTAVTH